MKRVVLCLTLLASVSACETSLDPLGGIVDPGGGVITQAQINGSWSFTLQQTGALGTCPVGSLPNGQVIPASISAGTTGALNAATSTWADPQGFIRPLSGTVTLTTGRVDLIFAAGNTAAGMELIGTMSSAGTLTGTMTDPAPGLAFMFSAGCSYSVTGTKTS